MTEPSRRSEPFISVVAAARPNFVKVAPVLRMLSAMGTVDFVHTGQHYDGPMSDAFFEDLKLPAPDINLDVGSGTHAEQTAGVLVRYETRLLETRPSAVVVVGDVNSTLAATLAASKLSIPVAHIEAGLRSNDWSMPEEINRVVTDHLSTWLFTPSADANDNLNAEGIAQDRIHLVGNVMIDTLLEMLPNAQESLSGTRVRLGLPLTFAVLTLHRPSNVDTIHLDSLSRAITQIAREMPVVFPVHPRTAQRLEERDIVFGDGVFLVEPLGYQDFLGLMTGASVVLTDSGGVQEETSVLGIPCLTLRESTERPITCELGTNTVVGTEVNTILDGFRQALSTSWHRAQIPYWDGKAAERIVDILMRDLGA